MPEHLSPREILEHLVRFRSVSTDSNLDLIDWVETWLAGWGIVSHRVYNAEGTKAALYASVGPDVPGGVILSGHTDVVPVAGQNWSSDPWSVVERDGRLFGRGVCDMKGFDALALAGLFARIQRGRDHSEGIQSDRAVCDVQRHEARLAAAADGQHGRQTDGRLYQVVKGRGRAITATL